MPAILEAYLGPVWCEYVDPANPLSPLVCQGVFFACATNALLLSAEAWLVIFLHRPFVAHAWNTHAVSLAIVLPRDASSLCESICGAHTSREKERQGAQPSCGEEAGNAAWEE